MKKILMMVVAAMMATVNANAQFEQGTWSLQPMIGGGAATLTNADDVYLDLGNTKIDNQMTAAGLTGIELEYQFAEKMSVAAGLNLSIQGTGWENFRQDGVKYENPRAELSYVKVPLLFNYYFAKGWAVKAGVQFGFMVDANIKTHIETTSEMLGNKRDVTIDYAYDMKDDFEKFDFSIPIGISYQFRKPWVIGAQYQLGLTKVNKHSGDGIKDMKNSVFMLTFGYKFAL